MALTPYPDLATLPEVIANGGTIPGSFRPASYISLRNGLGIPSDATIAGVGSATFSDAGYGTLNLPARARTPIGDRPAETVTQRIQAALDTAANGPLGIHWDVACSIGVSGVPGLSGDQLLTALTLRRPGNLHVVGRPGCGAILRAQCNSAMFANEMPTFGTITSGAGTDQAIAAIGGIAFGNVVFEGLYLNANSGTAVVLGGSPNQPSPTFGQNFYLNIFRLWGVQDITFRDCQFVGGAGFHVYFGNWQRVLATGCTVDSQGAGGTVGGNDCWHMNGPGSGFTLRDALLATDDDHIALNCADGNNNSGRNHGPSVPAWGSIAGVRAANIRALRATPGMNNLIRISTVAGVTHDDHRFDGIHGTVYGLALLLNSDSDGATPGTIGRVAFSDVDIAYTGRGIVVGDIAGSTGSVTHLAVRGGSLQQANDVPLVRVGAGSTVSLLGLGDLRSSGVTSLVSNAGTITTALARSVSAGAHTILANSGTVGTLVASNIDPGTTATSGTAPGATSGDYYGSGGGGTPTISLSPSTLIPSTSGQTVTVTGTNTAWTNATTFAESGLSGTSIASTVVHSRNSATLTVNTGATTGTATITCSDFATASLAVASGTTKLDDVFTGTTGATLTGHTPTPTANGSDTWADLSGSGLSTMKFSAGGGVTSASLAGGGAFASYALTGVAQDQDIAITFQSASHGAGQAVAQTQFHRDGAGLNTVAVAVDFSADAVVMTPIVGGTAGSSITDSSAGTLAINTPYTLRLVTSGGTVTTATLNGTTLTSIQGATIPTGTGTILLIGQTAGTAGDITFTEAKVS